jgi:predicted alpha/beta hydrolase
VRLRALDGYELGGIFYAAARAESVRRTAVLHSGAGIPAQVYGHFASFLAEAGIPVLTYDYRGIGLSRPAKLRSFKVSIEDWAEYDCAGAIAWLRQRFPHAEMLGVAHSVGTLLYGGAPNASEQAMMVLVAAHTGYYGDYRPLYRLPMAALWHGVMPVLARTLGYFPASLFGLGADIPAGIALQWGARRSPDIRPTGTGAADERTRRLLERCASLRRPAILASMSDDAFATDAGVKRLLSYYPQLLVRQQLLFAPADAGVSRLGHIGFFRRHAGAALWPRLLAQMQSSAR